MKINFNSKKIIGRLIRFFEKKRGICFWLLIAACFLAAAGIFWRFAWDLPIYQDGRSGLTKINVLTYERILNRWREKQVRFQAETPPGRRDIFR